MIRTQSVGRALACASIAASIAAACAAPAQAGSIRARIAGDQKVTAATAIERDTHGSDGVVSRNYSGRVAGDEVVFDNLPDAGSFDLRLETAGGLIAGWNAAVAADGDARPEPLSAEAKRALLDKLAGVARRGFPHEVVVLDIQGNAEHAVVLATSVRRGNIQGAGAVGGWVWRADRYEYENPDDDTWAPLQEQPFYAVDRREVSPQQYAALRVVYVAALGGIGLSPEKPVVDLGRITLPAPAAGVHAAAADGRPTREFTVKPRPAEWPAID
ncbi:MAG TPA: hypothetical protein VMF30_06195 [Pirellulales bacterium]|nr:hypothetical protein [Pirellulales bacterium]